MSAILRTIIFLSLLLAGFILIAFYWTFYKPLPDYNAEIELPGITEPVDIHWDPFGVPHIHAENERDLYYAVGYVHAQDRLWQMTLAQLIAEGRFAEFLGEDLVEIDRYHRTLGFWDTAGRIEQESSPEILGILQAYADGVNDYIETNRRNLTSQFALLGMEPLSWTPRHSLAISRLMAWKMNVSWWGKMTYGYLYNHLPPSVMEELFPGYGEIRPAYLTANNRSASELGMAFLEREMTVRKQLGIEGGAAGSNAWVAAGSRTDTGLPILAGDPHMELSIPGNWYELHLSSNGRNLSGATMPGAPVVVLGQNDRIAWSLTNMMADDTDFFVEIEDPENPDHFLTDTTGEINLSEPFGIRDEVIRVRGTDDQLHHVRETDHGPVISDIFPEKELVDDQFLSMAWTGHRVSHEIESLYRVNWAEDMDGFVQALRQFRSPGLNFAYADRDGNIGLISAAGIPIRDHNPLLFRSGRDPSWDWQGWIPFDDLPRIINPESGFAANANNRFHDEDYPYYISTFWEPSSRIQRIEQVLQSRDTLTVDLFQELQMDTHSPHAEEFTEMILPVLRSAEEPFDFSDILPYLENWDFRYDPESSAASIFDTFFMKLARNTLEDELGEIGFRNLKRSHRLVIRILSRLLRQDSQLFNDETTDVVENRSLIIRRSMSDAVEWLKEYYGDQPADWQWGNLHTVTLKPPFFSEVADNGDSRVLGLIVNNLMNKGPYPAPGNGLSVNKGEYSWVRPFDVVVGPSIRRIVSLQDPGRSYTVLPTGQSGNPLSEFYGDQTELWLEGNYRYMYQDSTFFREVSYQTMRLLPD